MWRPRGRKSPGFNGRNIPGTWGENPKTKAEKHNVPSPPQSTWELAPCTVMVLKQGWNITQTLASPQANSLHFWNGLAENKKSISATRILFIISHPGCLFYLVLDRTHPILSAARWSEHRWRPTSLPLQNFLGRVLYLFWKKIVSHCWGGWHPRVCSAEGCDKRCPQNCYV